MLRKSLGKIRRTIGGIYRHHLNPWYLKVAVKCNVPMAKTSFELIATDESTPNRKLVGWKYGSKYLANYELPTRKFIRDNVMPGDVCIDIGANIGVICISMVDAGLRNNSQNKTIEPFVYAIEPSTKNRKILSKNLSKNGLAQFVNVSSSPIGSQTKSVLASLNSVFGRRIEKGIYDFISLDDFVAQNKISNLKIIKIDVDGFELEVLTGAKTVLRDFDPTIIIELDPVSSSMQGHTTLDVITKLNSYGYIQKTYLSENPYSGNAVFCKSGHNVKDKSSQ